MIAVGNLLRARGLEPRSYFRDRASPDPGSAKRVYPVFDSARYDRALHHYYSLAVAIVRKEIDDHASGSTNANIEVLLMSCIIYTCFNVLQGSHGQAAKHLRTDLKILIGYINAVGSSKQIVCPKRRPSTPIEIMSNAFVSPDYDLTTFRSRTPYLT